MLLHTYYHPSPLGTLEIKWQGKWLYSISKSSAKALSSKPAPDLKASSLASPQSWLFSFLDSYFSENLSEHSKVFNKWPDTSWPFFERGSVFQKKVWAFLRTIPYGEVFSYTEVAEALNMPKSARAVGGACAQNPWLILVPCHRVVAKKGLGGFALGIKVKTFLLKREKTNRAFLDKKN